MRQLGLIETDWERNVKRISPLLGILLVATFAFFLYTILRDAMTDLSQSVHTEAPRYVSGTLRLMQEKPIEYKDSIEFRSTVQGVEQGATTFVTVACFQDQTLVYQRSAQQGVRFYLYDQYERDLEWDGGPASCSATLTYRTVGDQIDIYVLDAVSFEVGATTP